MTISFPSSIQRPASSSSCRLTGWYRNKPAELSVNDPFLILRCDNAELVFPSSEFRFEVARPSTERPAATTVLLTGLHMDLAFDCDRASDWSPMARAFGAQAPTERSPDESTTHPVIRDEREVAPHRGLRLVPPPPRGPMLSPAAASTSGTDAEPSSSLDHEASFTESITRRDLQLVDLECDDEFDALEERDPADFDGLYLPLRLVDDEADTSSWIGRAPVVVDDVEVSSRLSGPPWHGRFFGEQSDSRWVSEVVPVFSTAALIAMRMLQIAVAIVAARRVVGSFTLDAATGLDRVMLVALAIGFGALLISALSAIGLLMRGRDYEFFTLREPLPERLRHSSRKVGLAAFAFGFVVVSNLIVTSVAPDAGPLASLSWSELGWSIVSVFTGLALATVCATRFRELTWSDGAVNGDDMRAGLDGEDVR